MRRTNINAVLRMVREYLNGDMNEIDFYLDFPYEIEKRYQKMCREDPDYADLRPPKILCNRRSSTV